MEIFQSILVCTLLTVWLFFGVVFLITTIQTMIFERNHEKRERAQEMRDLEYHNKRMETLK